MGKLVNKSELSEIVSVSERTLTTWQKNGMPIELDGTRGVENIYDTEAVIKWMIQREIQRRIADHGDEGDYFDFEKERARLTHHQANMADLDEQVKRGRLVPAEHVENEWADLVMAFRSRMLAIPTKAAHYFIALTDIGQIERCLKDHIYEALTELSQHDYQDAESIDAESIDAESIDAESIDAENPQA